MSDPRLELLDAEERAEYEKLREALAFETRRNPLLLFHSCPEFCGLPSCVRPTERHPEGGRPKQREYMLQQNRIVLEAAGNRFGKTVGNVVWAIIQHTPLELLPERLHEFKRPRPHHVQDLPVTGRYTAPSETALRNIVWPEVQRWVPKEILRGGSWDKAFTTRPAVLNFADGGRLEFFTNEQDAAVRVGTSLDYAIFDEPVTEAVWKEDWIRLGDRRGQARFGLTPVNMKGGGIGWLYRDIYKRGVKGEPYPGTNLVPVVLRGTIHDNPTMTADDIAEALAIYPEDERNARETGEFVAFSGIIYPNFKSFLVPARKIEPKVIQKLDTIVGIDPSYTNCAIVWVAFNDANHGLIYHEELVQRTNPNKIRQAIMKGNSAWGLKQHPLYVMDPYAGAQHSMLGATTIKEELKQLGIYTQTPKVLDNDAIRYGGIANVWRRMQAKPPHFAVSSACARTIEEAEEYRTEERDDGVFEVVKEHDHFMDAMRYAFTWRPWYPPILQRSNDRPLIVPGQAPAEGWNEGLLEEAGDLL